MKRNLLALLLIALPAFLQMAFGQTVPLSITSFTPPGGPTKTIVTVLGAGFTGVMCVVINAASGAACIIPTVLSDSKITFVVPDSTPGAITVLNGSSATTSAQSFAWTAIPYVAGAPPTCLPAADLSNVHTASAIGVGTQTILSCVNADGTVAWWAFGGSLAELAQPACIKPIDWTQSASVVLALVWNACINRVNTPDEMVLAQSLAKTWAPRVLLTQATASPVYTINADGAETLLSIGGVAQTVSMTNIAGSSCGGPATIDKTGRSMYSMVGLTSDQGIPFASTTPQLAGSLTVLAAATNGNKPASLFTITYTDGSTSTVTQGISDWFHSAAYPGETIVAKTTKWIMPTGVEQTAPTSSLALYGYVFPLSAGKTVKSLTLPPTRNITIFGLAVNPALAPAPLSLTGANLNAISIPGTAPTLGGIDGSSHSFDATQLSSVTFNGTTFPLATGVSALSNLVEPIVLPPMAVASNKASYAQCSILQPPKDTGFIQ